MVPHPSTIQCPGALTDRLHPKQMLTQGEVGRVHSGIDREPACESYANGTA